MSHSLRTITAVVLCSLAIACGRGETTTGNSESGGGLSGTIQIDGSSTDFPISEAAAEVVKIKSADVRATVGISGTGAGFQTLCRGETDISHAPRPIRAAEMETCQKAGIEFIESPVAYDGLAIVVTPKNTWATSM